MIYRCVKNATALSCWKVSLKPFQRLVGAAAIGGRASQGAKLPYRSKAPQRGECQAAGLAEGNRTSGGFPFLHKAFSNRLPAFFFGSRGANENSLRCAQLQLASRFALSKKEHAARDISPRARGDQRSARWMGGRFLKKATEKLSTRHRRGVLLARQIKI